MADSAIQARVYKIIKERLGLDEKEQITMDSHFIDDLRADSLDIVDLIMTFEDEFGIEICDKDAEEMTLVRHVVDYLNAIFKRLFEDGLKIQKARINDLRNYAREKREESSKRQQVEIDSLENYYRNQFSMLAEAIATERYELQVRDKAQTKVMEQMKRDMRRKMEQEIRDVQEQMYQDEDTEYFRQLEADRMRRELQMASYKTMM